MPFLDDFLASSYEENDDSTAAEDDSTYGGDEDHHGHKKKQAKSILKKQQKRSPPPMDMEVICLDDTPPPNKRRKNRQSIESSTVKTLDSMSSPAWPSQGTDVSGSFSQSHSVLATQGFSPLPGKAPQFNKPPRVSNDVSDMVLETSDASKNNEFSTIEEAKLALQKRKGQTDTHNNSHQPHDSLAKLEDGTTEEPILRLTKTNRKVSEASKKKKSTKKSASQLEGKQLKQALDEPASGLSQPAPPKKQKTQSHSVSSDSQETIKPKKSKKSKTKDTATLGEIVDKPQPNAEVSSQKEAKKSSKTTKPKKKSKSSDTKDSIATIGKENSEPKPQKPAKAKTKDSVAKAAEESRTSKASSSTTESTKATTSRQDPPQQPTESSTKKPAAASVSVKQVGSTQQPGDEPIKKKKKKKLKFDEMILNHMLIQEHKPFTLKSLAQELDSTENALNYSMLSLLDKGVVIKKEFTSKSGRSKVLYWAVWGAMAKEVSVCMATPKELKETKAELTELERQHTATKTALKMINSEMPNEEVDQKLQSEESAVTSLTQEIAKVKARIAQCHKAPKPKLSRGPPKTAAQLARERCPKRLKTRFNHMRTEWVKRKQKCIDVVDLLADGMEKNPKEVVKLLDLETDEMENVKIPPKKEIQNDDGNKKL